MRKEFINIIFMGLLLIFNELYASESLISLHDLTHGNSIISITTLNPTENDILRMKLKAFRYCKGTLMDEYNAVPLSEVKNPNPGESYYAFYCHSARTGKDIYSKNKHNNSLENSNQDTELKIPSLSLVPSKKISDNQNKSDLNEQKQNATDSNLMTRYIRMCEEIGIDKTHSKFNDCVTKFYEIDKRNTTVVVQPQPNSYDSKIIDSKIEAFEKMEQDRRNQTLLIEGLKLLQQSNQPYLLPSPNTPIRIRCIPRMYGQVDCNAQ